MINIKEMFEGRSGGRALEEQREQLAALREGMSSEEIAAYKSDTPQPS